MLEIIDKSSKNALSMQVSEKLIEDIRSGKIQPGKRIPGERRLAERFGISRGTVIEALDLLESQNYIERIPAKGTFVSDDINHELSLVKIAFPFPEASITPASLGSMENWGAVSEVYRGMIEEATSQNAEVSFIHFEEAENEIQLIRQLRRLEDMNAVIFIGHQLKKLRTSLRKRGTFCVLIGTCSDLNTDAVITSDLKYAFSQLACFAKSKNYKRLRIISELKNYSSFDRIGYEKKLEVVSNAFKQSGIEVDSNWFYKIENNYAKSFSEIFTANNFDLQNGTDLIYLPNANTIPLFYRYCFDNDIKLGKNIGAFGYASGITFTNLMPSFTYSKINHFEMGRCACRNCISAVRNGRYSNSLVRNILNKGESI